MYRDRVCNVSHTSAATINHCPVTGMEFVKVPGGVYTMGDIWNDNDCCEKHTHKVTVKTFYLARYQVTQTHWQQIMGNNPSCFNDVTRPVENVSWDDAQEFIAKLNNQSGNDYRLPSEAEWEYAARSGGKKEKWSGCNENIRLGDYAWYTDNSDCQTHPVGQKRANGLGLYDMSGNVYEWCQNSGDNFNCAFRGGSWDSSSEHSSTFFCGRITSNYISNCLGLRLLYPASS